MFERRNGNALLGAAAGAGAVPATLAGAGAAQAASVVAFEFTAEVDAAGEPWASRGIAVGDPVFGAFAYDPNTADAVAGNPDFGVYPQTVPSGARVSVGGFGFVSSNDSGEVYDDNAFIADSISLRFDENVSDGGIALLGFASSPFFSPSSFSDIFDGDALFEEIDLSLFSDSFGGLLSAGPNAMQPQYTITSVRRTTDVPLPAPAILSLASLAGLLTVARRRRAELRDPSSSG